MWMTMRIGARVGLLCAVVLGAVSQWQHLGITVPWGGVAAHSPGISLAILIPGTRQGWDIAVKPRNEQQDAVVEQAYSGNLYPDTINWGGGYLVFFTGRGWGMMIWFRHWFVVTAFACLNILVWWLGRRRKARTCED